MKYTQQQTTMTSNVTQGQVAMLALGGVAKLVGRFFGVRRRPIAQPEVKPAREVSAIDFASIKLEPGKAVYFRPKEVFTLPSSRVITVTIEGAKGVAVGRIWLYLYRHDRKIRRVFRIEDEQVRAILGTKNRFYMTDVPWNVEGGDEELARVRHQSAMDVERIIVTSHSERMKKNTASPRGRSEYQGHVKIAADKPEPKAEKVVPSPAQAPVKPPLDNAPAAVAVEPQPTPSAPTVSSVERPVAGRSYVGVISEMGRTTRQGSEGKYEAFCVKLESDGVHTPLYGVELEREIIERQAAPGDKVRVVFMQRQPIEGQGPSKWKNLYKVEVLHKGAK